MNLFFWLLGRLMRGIAAVVRWVARSISKIRLKLARKRGEHLAPEQARKKIRDIHEDG
jgi:hypothetical protein